MPRLTTSSLSSAKTVSTVRSSMLRRGRGSKATSRRIANPADQLTVDNPTDPHNSNEGETADEGLSGPAGLVSVISIVSTFANLLSQDNETTNKILANLTQLMTKTAPRAVTNTAIEPLSEPDIYVRCCKAGPRVDECWKKDGSINCTYCGQYSNLCKHVRPPRSCNRVSLTRIDTGSIMASGAWRHSILCRRSYSRRGDPRLGPRRGRSPGIQPTHLGLQH